jgi:hypothetical protein
LFVIAGTEVEVGGGTGDDDDGEDDEDFDDDDDLGPVGIVSLGLVLLLPSLIVGDSFPPLAWVTRLLPLTAVALLIIMSDSILLHARVSMANGLLLASKCC